MYNHSRHFPLSDWPKSCKSKKFFGLLQGNPSFFRRSKQIIHCHYTLHSSAIFILCQAVGGDKSGVERFAASGFGGKDVQFSAKFGIIFAVYDEIAGRELHFAHIDNSVGTVYQHVYLGLFRSFGATSPRRYFGMYRSYAQSFLNFILMYETYFLKRESAPSVQRRRQLVVLPKTGIGDAFSVDETKIEEGVEVR